MKFTLKTKDYNTTCIKRADNTLHLCLRVRVTLTRKQLKRFVCMNFVKMFILLVLTHLMS